MVFGGRIKRLDHFTLDTCESTRGDLEKYGIVKKQVRVIGQQANRHT